MLLWNMYSKYTVLFLCGCRYSFCADGIYRYICKLREKKRIISVQKAREKKGFKVHDRFSKEYSSCFISLHFSVTTGTVVRTVAPDKWCVSWHVLKNQKKISWSLWSLSNVSRFKATAILTLHSKTEERRPTQYAARTKV